MPPQPDPSKGTDVTPQERTAFVPIPDPTTLTIQFVSRAIVAVREVLEAKIQDIDNNLTRIEPMILERIEALKELKDHDMQSLHAEIVFLKDSNGTTSMQ